MQLLAFLSGLLKVADWFIEKWEAAQLRKRIRKELDDEQAAKVAQILEKHKQIDADIDERDVDNWLRIRDAGTAEAARDSIDDSLPGVSGNSGPSKNKA